MAFMSSDYFDLVVVGGGSAGYAAARTAAAEGLQVAVVEGAETMGGLCILRGCMPSKALLATASVATAIKRAHQFGLQTSGFSLSGKDIVARKAKHVGDFASYRQQQLEQGAFELIRGYAKFLAPRQIEVALRDGRRRCLSFQYALLATGSEIVHVNIDGLAAIGYLTSDEVLEMTEFPKSMVVLGGGAIALEMATYLAALGVETTLIQRSQHVLSDGDQDIAEAITEALESAGIRVHTDTKLQKAYRNEHGKVIEFQQNNVTKQVVCEEILQALGRQPAVNGLNLQSTGARLEGNKFEFAATQQVAGCDSLFVAGDVCGPHEIVHIAIQQGELAARNIARLLRDSAASLEAMDYRLRLFVVFTNPEVAVAGLSEADAKKTGIDYQVASYPFNDHGKSLVMEEIHGFVKLLADSADGKLIGGAVVGPHGAELIHEIVVALAAEMTAGQLANLPHYHPTLSEIWTYPAEELAEKLQTS